jgi:hypothetical protein
VRQRATAGPPGLALGLRPGRARWCAAASAHDASPAVVPHDPFHRAPRHLDALTLHMRPHLQAAVQALRRAFPVGVGFVVAARILVIVVSHRTRFDGADERCAQ